MGFGREAEKKCKELFRTAVNCRTATERILLSEEKYSTGTTLYYIPIEPIYQMLREPKHKQNAHLLLSVCSYLYHIADVPYYRQQGSYLYWLYEMHREWTEQDEDREDNERYVREFDKAELIGDCMEQKIFNPMNLTFFEKRLNTFESRDVFDRECLDVAQKAFALYSDYPNESIFRNAPYPTGREDETRIRGHRDGKVHFLYFRYQRMAL
jgi:hypothetical protein